MPYLKRDWMIGDDTVTAGTWIPERNGDRWMRRAANVAPQYLPWRLRSSDGSPQPVTVSEDLKDRVVRVVAADIVSAQRDGLLYRNLIERLKNSPTDETADQVVDQMQAMGMASASWPEAVGGPPPHQSPRPWRRVLDWLLWLAGEVTRMLFDMIDKVRTWLASVGVSAVAVGLSWSPEISFEFPTPELESGAAWHRAREFLDSMVEELEDKVFSLP